MSAQYSLFDSAAEVAGGASPSPTDGASMRAAEGGPYEEAGGGRFVNRPYGSPQAWRGPMPGMRFLKLGLADGTSIIVETKLSMFELSNELRSKGKVALTLADGRSVEIKSLDVAYLENVYIVRV